MNFPAGHLVAITNSIAVGFDKTGRVTEEQQTQAPDGTISPRLTKTELFQAAVVARESLIRELTVVDCYLRVRTDQAKREQERREGGKIVSISGNGRR